jgi:SAM-dependent MidA family methyltransferase
MPRRTAPAPTPRSGRRVAGSAGRAPRFQLWSEATRTALYGHGGFFHRPEGPAGHFRTSVHASPLFAVAVAELLRAVDAALDHPDQLDFVDVGAGRGELLLGVAAQVAGSELAERLRLWAVELAQRPTELAPEVEWSAELPTDTVGLLLANEWLDSVPVDVVEASPDGPRRVLVDPVSGEESPGGPAGLRDAGWLARWWPLAVGVEGCRAEVGFPRDAAWATAVGSLRRGLAVAIDYGHLYADRAAGHYAAGTLTGYREGRPVRPVPDGSCDLTSYVAVDACAASGEAAGARATALLRQRDALGTLLPGPPSSDAAGRLAYASQSAELRDPDGLGAFYWLAQAVGADLPAPLAGAGSAPGAAG